MSVIPTPSVDPSDLSRLHARLVTAADRDGLLDLAYRPSTPPSDGCCSSPPTSGWSGWPTHGRTTT